MRKTTTALIGFGLVLGLSACSGDDGSQDPAEEQTSVESTDTDTDTETEEQETDESGDTESADTESGDSDEGEGESADAAAEPEMIPVPEDGPADLEEFPIPAGTEPLGSFTMSGLWQFSIATDDPASVIAFYEEVRPELGYELEEGPSAEVGANTIDFEYGFSGPAYGTLYLPDSGGTVDIQVSDEPVIE